MSVLESSCKVLAPQRSKKLWNTCIE
jgi:hypothetical protein